MERYVLRKEVTLTKVGRVVWQIAIVVWMGTVACRSPQSVPVRMPASTVAVSTVPVQSEPVPTQPAAIVTPTTIAVSLATAEPTPITTATPTATSQPTATDTPAATAPAPRQLTSGGCCWEPFWLDGRVTFLDRPSPDAPVGFYAVPPAGGEPVLVESRLGTFHNGGAFFSYPDDGRTIVERRSDGQQWVLYNEGQPVLLSPDGTKVAWMKREWAGSVEERYTQFWWSVLGERPNFATGILGGGLIEWMADGRWLGAGRLRHGAIDGVLFTYQPETKERLDLFTASWFRGVVASPDGRWVIFLVGQDPQPERNGLWLARTDGSELRKLDWFGAYAWRDAEHLFYLPFEPGAASQAVWLYDVATNSSRRLTDPVQTPLKIAQGNFFFTPDGRALVYVSAEDNNLWMVPLPEG